MSREELDYQIDQCSAFCSRGGNFYRWIESKGFTERDKAYIELAMGYENSDASELLTREPIR